VVEEHSDDTGPEGEVVADADADSVDIGVADDLAGVRIGDIVCELPGWRNMEHDHKKEREAVLAL
jgi:hypothetical protein